jgi:hypothetical protein
LLYLLLEMGNLFQRGSSAYRYAYSGGAITFLSKPKEETMERRDIASRMLFCSLCIFTLVSGTGHSMATRETAKITSAEYQERPALESSLFRSDKDILGEDAIQRILSSKLKIPDIISIALYRVQESQQQAIRYYGYGYWRSEEYLKVQQSFISTITDEISKSDRVQEVVSLPSLLTPKEPTISIIRETSVRLQADMVMVFSLNSDVYEKYRLFQTDQAKAYCTCEGFLLDVRTGLIPFSRIVTTEYLATKEKSDANFNETMARAEREAALLSLKSMGEQAVEFLSQIPKERISEESLQPAYIDFF